MQRLLARIGREHALGEVGQVAQVPAGRHGQQRIGRRRARVRVGELGRDLVGRQLAHAGAAVRAELAAVERVRRLDEGDRHPLERGLEVGLRLRRVVERQVAVVLRRGDRTPEQPPPVFVEERLRAGAVGGGAGRARQDRRERRADQRGGQRLRGVDVVAGLLGADLREPVVVEAVGRDATGRQRRRPLPLHLGEDVAQRVQQLRAGQQPQERPPRLRARSIRAGSSGCPSPRCRCCRRCRCRRCPGSAPAAPGPALPPARAARAPGRPVSPAAPTQPASPPAPAPGPAAAARHDDVRAARVVTSAPPAERPSVQGR